MGRVLGQSYGLEFAARIARRYQLIVALAKTCLSHTRSESRTERSQPGNRRFECMTVVFAMPASRADGAGSTSVIKLSGTVHFHCPSEAQYAPNTCTDSR
jgi:hypothetical protein